jgi:P-type Cu+ transporter
MWMEKDPVCGMLVDPEQTAGRREYAGKTYYLCSPTCLSRFDAEPQRYAQAQERAKE